MKRCQPIHFYFSNFIISFFLLFSSNSNYKISLSITVMVCWVVKLRCNIVKKHLHLDVSSLMWPYNVPNLLSEIVNNWNVFIILTHTHENCVWIFPFLWAALPKWLWDLKKKISSRINLCCVWTGFKASGLFFSFYSLKQNFVCTPVWYGRLYLSTVLLYLSNECQIVPDDTPLCWCYPVSKGLLIMHMVTNSNSLP